MNIDDSKSYYWHDRDEHYQSECNSNMCERHKCNTKCRCKCNVCCKGATVMTGVMGATGVTGPTGFTGVTGATGATDRKSVV